MKKSFIMDTNVLLSNPRAIFSFEDNDIYIPIIVIEEIDAFKKGLSELGRNARHFSRILDGFRSRGSLSSGVNIFPENPDSGKLYVMLDIDSSNLPQCFENKPDNLILSAAITLGRQISMPVVLITKDSNLRIKGDALGISCEDLTMDRIDLDELYTGVAEVIVDFSIIDEFMTRSEVSAVGMKLLPNQYVILKDRNNPVQFVYGRFASDKNTIKSIDFFGKSSIWGIYPRNMEQNFALDLLLDEKIKLVTLVGTAGTGKTLLAIAAALDRSSERNLYHKVLISRPIFPLGKDIGFLPGTLEEKLNPWMQPIFDNLELLLETPSNGNRKKSSKSYHDLMTQGILEVEPLTYIRGRSIPNQYFIVDEAQNLTPHEIKTILTRAGENTKVVLTGDPYQIDNPYVDAASNGLTYVIDKFKNQDISGHITLVRGERSALATIAANIL